jgi:competence protein ComEC
MAGASASIIRATIMSVVFAAAYLLKREPDIYNSCALSALIILIIDPGQLFNVGCQLSFVSVVSIAFFYPKLKSLMRMEGKKPCYIRFFSEGALVSLSAWLGTAPLIGCYFKMFSPVTLIANIFIVPLAGLITLCGFTLLITAFIMPPIAPAFGSSAQALAAILLKTNALFLCLPGAYFELQ